MAQSGSCARIPEEGAEFGDRKLLYVKPMFHRKTGRRVLIMLDELHQFFDLREKQ